MSQCWCINDSSFGPAEATKAGQQKNDGSADVRELRIR
jgi:hypothetical protein